MADKSLQDSSCPPERRIIVVGKTGAGKSSLANTLFGEKVFVPDHSSSSAKAACKSETKEVMNTELTLIDTPGLFDTGRSDEDQRSEIIKSVVECAPGAHAFLILLKVETYTKHEEEVVTQIFKYFSEEMLNYAVIVFTHGNQLEEGTTIQQFVDQNKKLKDVVEKCGDRCLVFDSRYWKKEDDPTTYRSNYYQLKQLLITVERLVKNNNGGFYTNEMLQEVEQQIQKHAEEIRKSASDLSEEEIMKRAKHQTEISLGKKFACVAVGVLLVCLFGTGIGAAIGAAAFAVAGVGAAIGCGVAVTGTGIGVGVAALAGAPINDGIARVVNNVEAKVSSIVKSAQKPNEKCKDKNE